MRHLVRLVLTFCFSSPSVFAQVAPAATGSRQIVIPYGLRYALRYAQIAQFNSSYSSQHTSTVSGSLSYVNRSKEKPFNLTYVGGYSWTLAGPSYGNGMFNHLNLNQVFKLRRWNFTLSDDVGYYPEAPTTGFSGIPGIGEIIGTPNPTPSTSQTILTQNTRVLSNSARGEVEHLLSNATSVSIGGSSDILHFPDGNGIDTRSTSATAELARRINARTSILGRYEFTQFDYPGTIVTMRTNTGLVGFQHRFTRNLSAEAFAGPQWINSSVPSVIKPKTTYAGNAAVTYIKRLTSYSASYFHGTNGGSGYLLGGSVDDAEGNVLYQLRPDLSMGFTGGYQRTGGLYNNGVTSGGYGAVQVTWQATRNLIVFANYTGRGQTTSSSLPSNVLTDTSHIVSFGVGFSPREGRLRP